MVRNSNPMILLSPTIFTLACLFLPNIKRYLDIYTRRNIYRTAAKTNNNSDLDLEDGQHVNHIMVISIQL